MYQANIFNISGRICAFCKYWDDDNNSSVKPLNKVTGIWMYDGQIKKICKIRNEITKSGEFCDRYECKVLKY